LLESRRTNALAPLPAGFFLKPIPCRSNKRQTALRLPLIRRLRIAATTSSSVKSGCSAIKPNRKFARFSNGDVLPPVGLAAMSQRCSHLTAELALISKRSAASRRDAPVITRYALASYGVDNIELHRRAASYIDRILRGEKPNDLPVQEATKFALIINEKTAKALGLTVPPALLARADEVIE
jgi:hypothetical protein